MYVNFEQKFDPTRFDPEKFKDMDTFSYLPFSGGSRYVCNLTKVIFFNSKLL